MSRQLQCPNCGGDHTLANPGITMLVCDYCKTVVYWDDETALKTGAQSILPESDTRLFMHARGRLGGRGFEVVGHLRYDHGRGTWDEWYLQLDDGGVAWLSEDERELSLEQPVSPESALPPPGGLRTGMPVVLAGQTFTVREMGLATCVGGEGQLPFTVLPGEQYPYADLASLDGTRFGTLEYDQDGRPTCFVGTVPGHHELQVEDEAPPSTAGAHQGQHITCPNCNAPLEVTGEREVETQVCAYCGAQNDLTGAEARVMGVNPQDYDPAFFFDIGQAGNFDGARYEVCGRMLYEDDEGYQGREYLLYNPERGYLWLAEENGHFVLNKPTHEAPSTNPFGLAPKQKVSIGGKDFRFYEAGASHLVYVDGALPWLASTGDSGSYADLVAPPEMFGVETDGKEVEYFRGRYMRPEEVWTAFGAKGSPPHAFGVHPAQPFVRGPVRSALMVAGLVFALVNLVLLAWSIGQGGKEVLSQSFGSEAYLRESFSRPFTLSGKGVVAMSISAPLKNSWMALQVALVNSKEQVVEEMEGEISYYEGYEGGEHWTEGSRTETTRAKAPPAGTYKLLLKASAGSGVSSGPKGERLRIEIREGIVLSRYFLGAFIISALFPVFGWLRRRMFEARRWGPVTEDDDDDD